MSEILCLKWNNHKSIFLQNLKHLRTEELYCDAKLACSGKYFDVHRLVLSTCSEYFKEIFRKINNQLIQPFIIITNIESSNLEALLNFMYDGEVNVPHEMLPGLIKAAELLKIKGLAVPDEEDIEKETLYTCEREPNNLNKEATFQPPQTLPNSISTHFTPIQTSVQTVPQSTFVESPTRQTQPLKDQVYNECPQHSYTVPDEVFHHIALIPLQSQKESTQISVANNIAGYHTKDEILGLSSSISADFNEKQRNENLHEEDREHVTEAISISSCNILPLSTQSNHVSFSTISQPYPTLTPPPAHSQSIPISDATELYIQDQFQIYPNSAPAPVTGVSCSTTTFSSTKEPLKPYCEPSVSKEEISESATIVTEAVQRLYTQEETDCDTRETTVKVETDHVRQSQNEIKHEQTDNNNLLERKNKYLNSNPSYTPKVDTLMNDAKAERISLKDQKNSSLTQKVVASKANGSNVIKKGSVNLSKPMRNTLSSDYQCSQTTKKCPKCNYFTKYTSTLRRHVMFKHTGEKPHKCKFCSYSSAHNFNMKKHLMTHTGEKPFSCPLCSYKATQNCNIKAHMKSHEKKLLQLKSSKKVIR